MDRKSSNRQVKSPLNFLLFIYIQDLDQHFLPIPNIPLRRFSELLSWTTAVLPMKVFPECVQRRVEGKLQEVVLSYTCNHCTNWLSRWGVWAGLMQHAGHTSGAPMGNRRGYRENGQIPHRQQWRAESNWLVQTILMVPLDDINRRPCLWSASVKLWTWG